METKSDKQYPRKPKIKREKTKYFTQDFTNKSVESVKMMELLRRVYDIIEIPHLTDNISKDMCDTGIAVQRFYKKEIPFPRALGDHIFNYLQSKDQLFRDIVIKRQKRYRRRVKKSSKKK